MPISGFRKNGKRIAKKRYPTLVMKAQPPVPTKPKLMEENDSLPDALLRISSCVRNWKKFHKLNDDAVITLIYGKTKVGKKQIKLVLETLQLLDKYYLMPEKEIEKDI